MTLLMHARVLHYTVIWQEFIVVQQKGCLLMLMTIYECNLISYAYIMPLVFYFIIEIVHVLLHFTKGVIKKLLFYYYYFK